MKIPFRLLRLSLPALALALLGVSLPCRATLGGDLSSVKNDQAHFKASLQVSPGERYAVQEMKVPSGTTIREYTTPSGKIFAVAWQGPWRPDLRQLLGDHFSDFQQAAKGKRGGHTGPFAAATSRLVIEMNGHPRAFYGRAYAPDLVPSGISPADIH